MLNRKAVGVPRLIILVTAIALVTATLVSWAAVRFRPLEVLRYE